MRKRLAASAGIALALLSMTACQSSPAAAAYVGGTEITEQRVSDVQKSTVVTLDNGTQTTPVPREKVVETLVLHKICEDRRAKEGFKPAEIGPQAIVQQELAKTLAPQPPAPAPLPTPKPGQTEEETRQQQEQANAELQKQQEQAEKDASKWQLGVQGSKYAELRAQALSCAFAIPGGEGVKPTEDELREIYDNALAVGAFPPGTTFAAASQRLAQDPQIASNIHLRREIAKMADETGVKVNPRYGDLSFPLLGFEDKAVLSAYFTGPNEVVQER